MIRHNNILINFRILKFIPDFNQPFFSHLIRSVRATTQGRPYGIFPDNFAKQWLAIVRTYSNKICSRLGIVMICSTQPFSLWKLRNCHIVTISNAPRGHDSRPRGAFFQNTRFHPNISLVGAPWRCALFSCGKRTGGTFRTRGGDACTSRQWRVLPSLNAVIRGLIPFAGIRDALPSFTLSCCAFGCTPSGGS